MSKEIWNHSCIISPSLICLDLCNLEQQAKLVEESGIQMLHCLLYTSPSPRDTR